MTYYRRICEPNETHVIGGPCVEPIDTCCGRGFCSETKPEPKSVPKTLIFVVEYYEQQSDLIKKYLLTYYGEDNEIQITDMIHKRRFLKRLKVDNVSLPELYIGNSLAIFGRKFIITECADTCTKQWVEKETEKAFLLVRPEAAEAIGSVVAALEKNKLKLMRGKMGLMRRKDVGEYFNKDINDPKMQDTLLYMTSKPVVALEVVGKDAVFKLRNIIGCRNPETGIIEDPQSLKARFLKDKSQVGFDIARGKAHEKNMYLFFDMDTCEVKSVEEPPTGTTLCIIKPHAVKAGIGGTIIEDIVCKGFKVISFDVIHLSRSHIDEWFEVYRGILPNYPELTAELSSYSCYAMEISKLGGGDATEPLREIVGQEDPEIARKLSPSSLRAKYGIDKTKNAIHVPLISSVAQDELKYLRELRTQQNGCM